MTKLSGRLIVDMDATLYDAPFGEACRVLWGADCPPTREATSWRWYEEYVSKEQWREAVQFVHGRQGYYPPFELAGAVLRMAQQYFYIIVTSQRPETAKPAVDWWLASNKIPADATVISTEDKTESGLFHEGDVVIDDAPHNIIGALKRGAHVITLSYPYNRSTAALGAKHVHDWNGIGIILEGVIAGVTNQRPLAKEDS